MARLVWTLGAMAAERVFYGENSNGVGGDVQSATAQAAFMVGASAMGPERVAVTPLDDETEEQARERVMKRFQEIGVGIMNRTSGGGPFAENPIAGVLQDRDKRDLAAQIIGQAYVNAYNLVLHNKDAVSQDRRRARRAARDVRGRARPGARPGAARDAGGRPEQGGLVAEDVTLPGRVEPGRAEVARKATRRRRSSRWSAPTAASERASPRTAFASRSST